MFVKFVRKVRQFEKSLYYMFVKLVRKVMQFLKSLNDMFVKLVNASKAVCKVSLTCL